LANRINTENLIPLVNGIQYSQRIFLIAAGRSGFALRGAAMRLMHLGLTVFDAHGNLLTLSAFRGKYVLLDFWASWCVPCRHSHPHLINLYNKYKDKGFDIIGIASDMGREAVWKEAIEKDNVGIWHHVLEGEKKAASKNDSDSISNQYGVAALPTKILIDPKGKIIGRYTGDGGNELDIELSKIFK